MSTETIWNTADAGKPRWWQRINMSDLIITIILLAVFTAALIMATGFKPVAAYFPLGVSALGVIGSLTFLVRVLFLPRKPEAPKAALPKETQSFSEAEYEFFRSLTRHDWLTSFAWLASFYVVLGVFGIYVASIAFTVAYLRFAVRTKWLFSVIYAVVLTGLVGGVFGVVLKLPLPGGLLGIA
ncbi:tripartite tricarboxylate transporter TctB family protein [Microbacterium rhizophilus]|uniref:tripartite tricarboxylate transporter TctB family protein n=1 Tax=Microbacterium rhizophilus TaxID=3138934 RepID=UPI0031EDA5E1